MSKFRVVLIVLTVLTVCSIWGQSIVPEQKSAAESKAVTEKVVQPIEEKVTGKKTITNDTVRKWAHGLEYAVLGLELVLLLGKSSVVKVFSYGVAVALLDETIQMMGDRGALIADVWIDSAGLVIGIILSSIILLFLDKFWKNRSGKN